MGIVHAIGMVVGISPERNRSDQNIRQVTLNKKCSPRSRHKKVRAPTINKHQTDLVKLTAADIRGLEDGAAILLPP